MADKDFDENIIIRIAKKDRDAFRELYQKEADAVYGLALSVLRRREDAEDVMHDAFIRIYTAADSYIPEGRPLAWIFTIVRRLCYNKLREAEKVSDEDIDSIDRAATANGIDEATDKMVLDAAMKDLEQDEREIITLHALTGLTYNEISDVLGMPQGTVMSRYSRALKKLRKILGGAEAQIEGNI